MPLDPVQIALGMSTGLSAVCSTCSLYWEARSRGIPAPKCLAKDGCGSPLAGDDFHEYKGPITDFRQWCFVCGKQPKFGVRVNNSLRVVGVCEEHRALLDQLKPVGRPAPKKNVVTADGKDAAIKVRREKPSLAKSIYEVEKYFADKEGREL